MLEQGDDPFRLEFPAMTNGNGQTVTSRTLRKRMGIAITVLGGLLFLLGANPGLFGLDFSPVIGYVQVSVFSFGLGLICLGGYFTVDSLWNGMQKTIAAEIGARLVGTGYVISLASGMADLFGLGTRPLPAMPFFGYWQARGVLLGEIVVLIGFLLLIPYWTVLFDWIRRLRSGN
jgi:hypothetical protein